MTYYVLLRARKKVDLGFLESNWTCDVPSESKGVFQSILRILRAVGKTVRTHPGIFFNSETETRRELFITTKTTFTILKDYIN